MRNFIAVMLLASLAWGCSTPDAADMSDPLSSARGFIEASLLGDYVQAEKYVLDDSLNIQYLNGLTEFSKKLSPLERENYRTADIIIDSTATVNDSTDIIYFKNTFKKEPTRLKLVRRGDVWKVDFKYTFEDEEQTSQQ